MTPIRVRHQKFVSYLKAGEWFRAETKSQMRFASRPNVATVTIIHVWTTFRQEIAPGIKDEVSVTIQGSEENCLSYAKSSPGFKVEAFTESGLEMKARF